MKIHRPVHQSVIPVKCATYNGDVFREKTTQHFNTLLLHIMSFDTHFSYIILLDKGGFVQRLLAVEWIVAMPCVSYACCMFKCSVYKSFQTFKTSTSNLKKCLKRLICFLTFFLAV